MIFKATLLALCCAAFTVPCGAAALHLAIDPSHTEPYYEIGHLGFSIERGTFAKVRGTIDLDAAAGTGAVAVSIDVASLNSNWPERDAVLKGEQFFDADRYPSIQFQSSDVRFDAHGTPVSVAGQLTLHGTSRPVTLAIEHFKCAEHPLLKKPWCGAEATATIRRSEFGITAFVPALPDDVHLVIPVEAGPR